MAYQAGAAYHLPLYDSENLDNSIFSSGRNQVVASRDARQLNLAEPVLARCLWTGRKSKQADATLRTCHDQVVRGLVNTARLDFSDLRVHLVLAG